MSYPIPRPTKYSVKVKRSAAGLGLFAEEDIPKGKFIIEYWGDLMKDEDAQEIGGNYLFAIGNGKTVVGTKRENTARYINHSCRPNCEIKTVGNRVYVYSCRNIKAGEELNYDYGEEYWEYYIQPHGCRCKKCKK